MSWFAEYLPFPPIIMVQWKITLNIGDIPFSTSMIMGGKVSNFDRQMLLKFWEFQLWLDLAIRLAKGPFEHVAARNV